MNGIEVKKKLGEELYKEYRKSPFGNSVLKIDSSVDDIHYDQNIEAFIKIKKYQEQKMTDI